MLAPESRHMLVTIAVISHNYGQFIRAAIDSALLQTDPGIEVLVVDDGSVDDSRDIINSYGGRVRAVFQDNRGHVEAVNTAIGAGMGEAFVFLDADDVLYPECIARAMARWRPGLSKLQFRLDTINADGVDQRMPFPAFGTDLSGEEIRRRSLLTGYYPWTVSSGNIFSREYLSQVTPIDSGHIFKSPDGYLSKMAPLFGPIETVPEVLGAYRVHGKNAWAQASSAVSGNGYSRTVRFDAVLHDVFVNAAGSMGLRVADYDHAAVPQMLESRMLSLRLSPGTHPIPNDTRLHLLMLGMRGALKAPGLRKVGRLFWMAWFLALTLLPAAFVLWTVKHSRSQTGRSKLASTIIHLSRRGRHKRLRHLTRRVEDEVS